MITLLSYTEIKSIKNGGGCTQQAGYQCCSKKDGCYEPTPLWKTIGAWLIPAVPVLAFAGCWLVAGEKGGRMHY